jgi:transcriptional regulator with GAF, ATPase, and Fis domain
MASAFDNRFFNSERLGALVHQARNVTAEAVKIMELYDQICSVVVGVGGYCMAWVGIPETDLTKSVRPVASAGFDRGYLKAANISWGRDERGGGPVGRAIRTGVVQINDHLREMGRMDVWRDEFTRRDYAAVMALPLCEGARVFAVLTVYSMDDGAFRPREIEVLSGIAEGVAAKVLGLREMAHERISPLVQAPWEILE